MKRTICLFLTLMLGTALWAADGLHLKTVVIDAGHGGSDPGAVSQDRKTYEKTFTLDISRKLAARIREACPDTKVVLTRDRDVQVSLNGRAECANKADADLFISIHINSTRSSSPNGYSVHLLGQSSNKDRDLFAYNMDVCRRENSVILLEDDYTTKYQGFDPSDPESYIFMTLMQNSHLEQSFKFAQMVQDKLKGGPVKADRGIWQNPFYVLWKTSMPAVLVELGFISNQNDLANLRNEGKRSDLAQRLFEAFVEYKAAYEGKAVSDILPVQGAKDEGTGVKAADTATEQPAPAKESPTDRGKGTETGTATASTVVYGVQIMAGGSKVDPKSPAFMGYEPRIVRVGNIYKYVIAVSESYEEVRNRLTEIRKRHSGAFIVKIQDGVVSAERR